MGVQGCAHTCTHLHEHVHAHTHMWTTRAHPPCSTVAETAGGGSPTLEQACEDAREGHEDQVGAAEVGEQRGGGSDEAPGGGGQQDDLLTPDPGGGQEDGDASCAAEGSEPRCAARLAQRSPGRAAGPYPPLQERRALGAGSRCPSVPTSTPPGSWCSGHAAQGEPCTGPDHLPRGPRLPRHGLVLAGASPFIRSTGAAAPRSSPSPAWGAAAVTGPPGGRPPPGSGSSPRRSC